MQKVEIIYLDIHARAGDAPLITKDEIIRRHYRRAIW